MVKNSLIEATTEGVAAVPEIKPLPTGVELQEYWMERLPVGERALLEMLIVHYPQHVPRETLSVQTGYLKSSRDTYLKRMAAKGIVTFPKKGEVRASENLF